MKPILIFNDKLDLHKEKLITTIVNGLKIYFVNVLSTTITDETLTKNLIINKGLHARLSAIVFKEVKQYDHVAKIGFRETLNIVTFNRLIESIYTPQLIFICNFPKADIPDNDISLYHIISVE